jgi:ABC-type polysaccharide transport system permease subunit
MAIKTKKKHLVQWTIEVNGQPGNNKKFYKEDEYWEFMENVGSAWHELGLQSFVDYYSVTQKSYVDWDDLNNNDRAWLLLHNITEQHDF